MNHKKITITYYEISLQTTNRAMPFRLDDFLKGCPSEEKEDGDWFEVLRDFEGDFEGIRIFNCKDNKEIIDWVSGKIGIDNPDCDIHIVN